MVTSSAIVSIAVLFLKSINFNERYIPNYTNNEHAVYFYRNSSVKNAQFRPIITNHTFLYQLPYFPKCCPPGYFYKDDNRECLPSNSTPIYDEIAFNTDLIKSGLSECPVLLDRFVAKTSFRRYAGNGYLLLWNETLYRGHYCLDNIIEEENFYVIRICQEKDYCLNGTDDRNKDWCVRKCCPDGYRFEDYLCVPVTNSGIRMELHKDRYERTDGYAVYYSSNMACSVANWHEYEQINFTIKTNGSLIDHDDNRLYKENEYCVDTMYNTDSRRLTDMVILCEFSKALFLKWSVVKVSVIITCICFAITIVLYIFYKKAQMLIIVGFCTIDLAFWIMYTMRIFYVNFGSFCIIFGYIYYFISLSRLSWLNILSCEIWIAVGNPGVVAGQTKHALWKRKVYYVAYAILVPAFFTAAFILAHQRVHPLPESIRPYIDVSNCGIDVKGADNNYGYIYLYIPAGLLIVVNLILFVKTVLHFLRIRIAMKKLSDAASVQKQKIAKLNRKRGIIILKLGLIMVVTWIYYLFAYLSRLTDHPISNTIGDILMFLNIFEGLYFLIIFVVKWKNVKQLLHKFKILKMKDTHHEESISTESVNEIIPMHAFKEES